MHSSAYRPGGDIDDTDINNLIGNPTGSPSDANKSLYPFASKAEATGKLAAIYGVGYGDRGYGQDSVNLSLAGEGEMVSGMLWRNVISAIETCAKHQGTSLDILPPIGEFLPGEIIEAFNKSDEPPNYMKNMKNYDIDAVVALIDTNRNKCSSVDMMMGPPLYTDTRNSSWGSGSTVIDSLFEVSFDSEDKARYFFNTGGAIFIKLSHKVSGGTAQDTAWDTLLGTSVGNVIFDGLTTTNMGTGSGSSDIGYYDLTNSYEDIYSGDLGSGTYSMNSVKIVARRDNYSGTNGGNGSTLRFGITLSDLHQHSSGGIDSVSPDATKLTVNIRRCTGGESGITMPPSPTVSGVSGFSFND